MITPRTPKTTHDHTDTIEEYVARKRSHDHHAGHVYYSPVFYEDFTDRWRLPSERMLRFPQRIDVDEWKYYVPDVSRSKVCTQFHSMSVGRPFLRSQDLFEDNQAQLSFQSEQTPVRQRNRGKTIGRTTAMAVWRMAMRCGSQGESLWQQCGRMESRQSLTEFWENRFVQVSARRTKAPLG